MYRVLRFLGTNIVVMLTLSVGMKLLGVASTLNADRPHISLNIRNRKKSKD